MSKSNPLAGLIGNYDDSDEDSDTGMAHSSYAIHDKKTSKGPVPSGHELSSSNMAGIHPSPIPHCPWSACYDESSGFTYYWNQKTNAVTWEAPPEYLLALKIAQQHLHTSGSTEVSAEEWQLYQQALVEKQNLQNKAIAKAAIIKFSKKPDTPSGLPTKDKKSKSNKKRPVSDDDEKIELITSYHNSDSESNDEAETPTKVEPKPTLLKPSAKVQKNPNKKLKTKPQVVEYGPNLNYTLPIGPELPPNIKSEIVPKSPENKPKTVTTEKEGKKPTTSNDNEDSQDESLLLKKLKDKAKLLEKLGGELPSELQQMIKDETSSTTASPKSTDDTNKIKNIDVDDLLEQIEKQEFSKAKLSPKPEVKDTKSNVGSMNNSPRSDGYRTPPLEELKFLFPSSKNISEQSAPTLFPSAVNVEESSEKKPESPINVVIEKKENIYLMDANEPIENVNRKKLRISNSVLPERKNVEKCGTPAYTTKYSQFIEGFSTERTGLGFSKEEEGTDSPKNTISYGNGLTFTKGEVLHEENRDEDLDDVTSLIEDKLKYLNELQPCVVTPVQEMLIQLQTLRGALAAGSLRGAYVRGWARRCGAALARHEAGAAPPGWTCRFLRAERSYRYRREADGLEQWEFPAVDHTDMDISTTPPHPGIEAKEEPPNPPLPPLPQAAPPASPPPPPQRAATPPPPKWPEPPPPGCDDPPPLPPEPKQEIGDELMSFYNDIAELEKQSGPNTASNSPEPPPLPESRDRGKDKDIKSTKKKSKVKISASMGLKHKSVSTLVAKWQQVADEISSD